jgi:hypothetical protein
MAFNILLSMLINSLGAIPVCTDSWAILYVRESRVSHLGNHHQELQQPSKFQETYPQMEIRLEHLLYANTPRQGSRLRFVVDPLEKIYKTLS